MLGLAPSARAADELRAGAAIQADTLAKFIYEHDRHPGELPDGFALDKNTTVVVDEAGMTSTTDLLAIRPWIEKAGAKLVLVGDHRQLDAVAAPGGIFGHIATGDGPGVYHLDRLHRFTQPWEADATRRLRERDPNVIDDYLTAGRVHGYDDTETAVAAVADAVTADLLGGANTVALGGTNRTVTALNRSIRARLEHEPGVLTGDEHRYGTLAVRVGDRLVTKRNDRDLTLHGGDGFVSNGMLWQATDATEEHVTVRSVANPAVTATLPTGYITDHVAHAYALTVHRSQGATVDTAHVLAEPDAIGPAGLYVAMTRGRDANTVHVTRPAPDETQHGTRGQRWDPAEALRDIVTRPARHAAALHTNRDAIERARNPDEQHRRRGIADDTADLTHRRPVRGVSFTERTDQLANRGIAQDNSHEL